MYAVSRLQKYKRGQVGAICKERNRTLNDGVNRSRSEIDPTASDHNITLIDCKYFDAEISRRLKAAGVKERDDSVVLIGGLYTASADYFTKNPKYVELPKEERDAIAHGRKKDNRTPEQRVKYLYDEKAKAFFNDCLQFHIKKCCQGDSSRVISAKIDFDETTPHLQVYSVPLHERENKHGQMKMHLSAKDIVGNRGDLRRMQDEFFEQIGKPRSMERGELVDWDIPFEERKKHKRTHEHKKEEQKAELAEQKAQIDKNDKIIEEQKKTQQKAAESLQRTQNDEARARIKLEKEAEAAALLARHRIKRHWLPFLRKDKEKRFYMSLKDYQNATAQRASVERLLASPVYTPQERQEMQREADAARRARKAYEDKAANIDKIIEERVRERVAQLDRAEPKRIEQLEQELKQRRIAFDYVVDAIKTFLEFNGFSVKKFQRDYGVKLIEEPDEPTQSQEIER